MDEVFLKKERRHQMHLERLGANTPRCLICGETDPRCLEMHHLAGRQFGNDVAVICRNCHRKLSDAQKDHPSPQSDPPSINESIGRFLLGLADFFEQLGPQFRNMAKQLMAKLTGAHDPGWGQAMNIGQTDSASPAIFKLNQMIRERPTQHQTRK